MCVAFKLYALPMICSQGSDEQMNCSLDLDEGEGESHSPLSSQEEPQAGLGAPGEEQDLPEGMQCGGEEPQTGGAASQRQRQSTERPDGSLVRRSRGEESLLSKMCTVSCYYYCLKFFSRDPVFCV